MDNLCTELVILNLLQIWRVAPTPQGDKYQYTHFAHKINSFDTAPKKLLASDSRLRPDRYALEKGDMSKSGAEKSRYFPLSSTLLYDCNWNLERPVCLPSVLTSPLSFCKLSGLRNNRELRKELERPRASNLLQDGST